MNEGGLTFSQYINIMKCLTMAVWPLGVPNRQASYIHLRLPPVTADLQSIKFVSASKKTLWRFDSKQVNSGLKCYAQADHGGFERPQR